MVVDIAGGDFAFCPKIALVQISIIVLKRRASQGQLLIFISPMRGSLFKKLEQPSS